MKRIAYVSKDPPSQGMITLAHSLNYELVHFTYTYYDDGNLMSLGSYVAVFTDYVEFRRFLVKIGFIIATIEQDNISFTYSCF